MWPMRCLAICFWYIALKLAFFCFIGQGSFTQPPMEFPGQQQQQQAQVMNDAIFLNAELLFHCIANMHAWTTFVDACCTIISININKYSKVIYYDILYSVKSTIYFTSFVYINWRIHDFSSFALYQACCQVLITGKARNVVCFLYSAQSTIYITVFLYIYWNYCTALIHKECS